MSKSILYPDNLQGKHYALAYKCHVTSKIQIISWRNAIVNHSSK